MTAAAAPWPAALAGSPGVTVIERAISRQRLAHGVLLQGHDPAILSSLAYAIADRLLNPPGARSGFDAEHHPDCISVRPVGKLRLIRVDEIRALIDRVQVTALVGTQKVAVLHEADRMNGPAANSFLKTLEEPPPNTTLLLLTDRPYALLPTIRSRVLHFRFPAAFASADAEGWPEWTADYRAWLGRLADGVAGARGAAAEIMTVYGLLARFALILERATALARGERKAELTEELEEKEEAAFDVGTARALRSRLFAEIERVTQDFARARLAAGDAGVGRAYPAAIAALEHTAGLMAVNLNESAALEDFLLTSLRRWSGR
jgi:DNA polymerase-3 subunit delta'